jgi:hypothetical protein
MHVLGPGLEDGAFPNLQHISAINTDDLFLNGLTASLENDAPCRTTLRRVGLQIDPNDVVHLPRFAHALSGLPRLEHADLWSPFLNGWHVEGGREALVELTRVIAGLESGNPEEMQRSIECVLNDLYPKRLIP